MAISSTTRVQRIEVYPAQDSSAEDSANAKHESVMVVYENVLSGTGGDAYLNGQISTQVKHLYKFIEDGGAATDVSSENALVQTVCGAIWA